MQLNGFASIRRDRGYRSDSLELADTFGVRLTGVEDFLRRKLEIPREPPLDHALTA